MGIHIHETVENIDIWGDLLIKYVLQQHSHVKGSPQNFLKCHKQFVSADSNIHSL